MSHIQDKMALSELDAAPRREQPIAQSFWRTRARLAQVSAAIFALVLVGSACSRNSASLDFWELDVSDANLTPVSFAHLNAAATKIPVEHHQAIAREQEECTALYNEISSQAARPGAPAFEKNRAMVLARSKAEPVLFVDEPKYTGEVSPGVEARRRAILKSQHPSEVLEASIKLFRGFPERLRQLALRDGYLYTDDPKSARLLTISLSLEGLFQEDEVFLQRGTQTLRLVRSAERHFIFADGEQTGDRARLLLFDRVWLPGETLGPTLHLDIRDFTQRLGVEGMRVVRITDGHILSELRFGNETARAVLEYSEPRVELNCLSVEPDRLASVGRARDEAYRRAQVMRVLREEIVHQVRAGLPFDEPKTENGQQDGELRRRFEAAYFSGQSSYKFNGDSYDVYGPKGNPLVPQVCVDFVTESLERASGMYWVNKGEAPKKQLGALDFDELLDGQRRREMALRSFARENPERLELIDFPQSEWVRYEKIDEFFNFVSSKKDIMRPGDIVIIRGRAAWDYYHHEHTHTFFIYESDPITNMPTLLAGNAGKPRIVTWDDEMIRAPKRSIRHRIRPNMDWLYDHVVLRTPVRGERWAAPLSPSEK